MLGLLDLAEKILHEDYRMADRPGAHLADEGATGLAGIFITAEQILRRQIERLQAGESLAENIVNRGQA